MRRSLLLAATAALFAVPAGLAAQQGQMRMMYQAAGHPRLGVTVNMRPQAGRDSLGAEIASVLPDSPADEAGLQAGDIITRFNGTPLAGAEGGPGQKLVELAQQLEVGDTARLEYRRDGKSGTAVVVARELPGTFTFRMPEMQRFQMRTPEPGMSGELPGAFGMLMRRMGGLELAGMNADLGQYFGTDQGVLVLATPPDSTLPLKAGDVILSIDGRTVQSVDHANRILASYAEGEKVTAQVMRKQKKVALSWTAHRPSFMSWHAAPMPAQPAGPPKKL